MKTVVYFLSSTPTHFIFTSLYSSSGNNMAKPVIPVACQEIAWFITLRAPTPDLTFLNRNKTVNEKLLQFDITAIQILTLAFVLSLIEHIRQYTSAQHFCKATHSRPKLYLGCSLCCTITKLSAFQLGKHFHCYQICQIQIWRRARARVAGESETGLLSTSGLISWPPATRRSTLLHTIVSSLDPLLWLLSSSVSGR